MQTKTECMLNYRSITFKSWHIGADVDWEGREQHWNDTGEEGAEELADSKTCTHA